MTKALSEFAHIGSSLSRLLPVCCAAGVLLCHGGLDLRADAPRALPKDQLPNDRRLAPPKDLDGYFPFTPSPNKAAWEQRAEKVRQQLRVALGLWPMPTKTPLNAVIHSKMDRGDYTVEKVFFESMPGFYVTGNLYRPAKSVGKSPGILAPHGHWTDGRFYDTGVNAVRREIVNGAERFQEGGQSPLQSRCMQLARMGCVVFHYDMIGYADSQQIPMSIAHGFAKQRPDMNTVENWGLFSPQAETHLQSVMGLQTWNSIRSLDFIESLPDVDTTRIGVSGASGGGTQTFILGALDPRVALAFPAVMVSTAMQGGCTCENASLLRVDTGNVEFAAMFAPKPLGMTAADDWTKEMTTKGFPELKKHFAMMGAPENVSLRSLTHFGHNYNYVSRAALYAWVNQKFKLGLAEPVVEEDYKRLTRQEMSVWDKDHPAPEGGPEFEKKLLNYMVKDTLAQFRAASSEGRLREVGMKGLEVVVGRTLSEVGKVSWKQTEKSDKGAYLQMTGLLRNETHSEELPVVFLHPKDWKGRTVIWLTGEGKSGLYDAQGNVLPEVKKLLDKGATVMGADLVWQGEFLADGKPLTKTPRVRNPREFAGYTLGYNYSVFAQRAQDVVTLVSYVKNHEQKSKSITLVGLKSAGPIAAAALSQCVGAVDGAIVETDGFRFGKVLDLQDPNLLPGGAKYGDILGMLALGAPPKLWVAGDSADNMKLLASVYRADGNEDHLKIVEDTKAQNLASAIDWIGAE